MHSTFKIPSEFVMLILSVAYVIVMYSFIQQLSDPALVLSAESLEFVSCHQSNCQDSQGLQITMLLLSLLASHFFWDLAFKD